MQSIAELVKDVVGLRTGKNKRKEAELLNDIDAILWRQNWVAKKVRLAECLAEGGCGAGYPEAAIVLCGALSALAADLWPGERRDKNRFVELLVRCTAPELGAAKISTPLLLAYLQEHGFQEAAAKVRLQWLNVDPSLVVYGADVDTTEENILRLCPTLKLKEIRKFSYATLLYEEIRSGYAHEYANADRSFSVPMGYRRTTDISYVNSISDGRLIHFDLRRMSDWTMNAELLSRGRAPDESFSNWWLDAIPPGDS